MTFRGILKSTMGHYVSEWGGMAQFYQLGPLAPALQAGASILKAVPSLQPHMVGRLVQAVNDALSQLPERSLFVSMLLASCITARTIVTTTLQHHPLTLGTQSSTMGRFVSVACTTALHAIWPQFCAH